MRRLLLGASSLAFLLAASAVVPACGSDDENGNNAGGDGGGPCTGFSCPQDGGPKPGCIGLECAQVTCEGTGKTTVSGTVFDPAGKVPVYNVTVYVPNAALDPISEGASCNRCDASVSGRPVVITSTDTSGRFVLENVPTGADIPLVMQIGKWRRKVTIPAVTGCADTAVDVGVTRLPRNRTEGDIPRIAVSTGAADPLQCLLRKIGLDDSEFGVAGSESRIHLFQGGGFDANVASGALAGGTAFQPSSGLTASKDELKKYDVVLLSCEGTDDEDATRKPTAAKQALYDYAAEGGRVFASHFHHGWFSDSPVTEVKNVATWAVPEKTPPAVPGNPVTTAVQADISTAFPKALAMKDWLEKQNALTAGKLPLFDARHNVDAVSANALSWISLANVNASNGPAVQYMTFNTPLGATITEQQLCGRVVYSTLHLAAGQQGGVSDSASEPFPTGCKTTELTAQQKALEFMLFDLSSCVQKDSGAVVPPK